MDQVRSESTQRTDFNMTLLVIFAGVALLLAAIGIYGLMAYSVQLRTQEIGIRMALGAGPHEVRTMVVKQGMRLALIGVFLGVSCRCNSANKIDGQPAVRREALGSRRDCVRRRAAQRRGIARDIFSRASGFAGGSDDRPAL